MDSFLSRVLDYQFKKFLLTNIDISNALNFLLIYLLSCFQLNMDCSYSSGKIKKKIGINCLQKGLFLEINVHIYLYMFEYHNFGNKMQVWSFLAG